MSRHQHHHHNKHATPESGRPKRIHQNPWLIFGVVLMFIAMIVYVMTMDESEVPADMGGNPGEVVPIAP